MSRLTVRLRILAIFTKATSTASETAADFKTDQARWSRFTTGSANWRRHAARRPDINWDCTQSPISVSHLRTAVILVVQEVLLVHSLFVRFEPRPGKAVEFREELLRVVEPTPAETGCVAINDIVVVQEVLLAHSLLRPV